MTGKILEVEKIIVKRGNSGIILDIQEDGIPVIGLFDASGQVRLSITGDPSIHLKAENEQSRIMAFLDEQGMGNLHFRSPGGQCLMLSVNDETPMVAFFDPTGPQGYSVGWTEMDGCENPVA